VQPPGTDWNTSGFDIPVGGSVTIEFTVTLANSVIPGETLQNSVDATFTSRDGADANERDGSTPGSNQANDADLNNYNETANAPSFTVADPVQLDKRFQPDPADDTYTIGELATYRLTVSLLEGTVDDLVVTDTLPAGVTFIDATVANGNLGITQGFTPPAMQVGQVLTFDFGQVVNPANGNGGDDFITIDIQVRIDDIVPNVDGTVLGNNAQLGFTGPGGAETRDFDADAMTPGVQPLDLTIVEPDVTVTKTPSRTNVSQGDTVTYSILLDHTVASSADAFDLEIIDTLPAGLTYVAGSASLPVAVAGQQLTFNVASLTLLDDNLTITYQARVDLATAVGAMLTNGVDLTYSSLPGADPNERTYMDSDTADVIVASSTFIDAEKTAAIAVDGGLIGVLEMAAANVLLRLRNLLLLPAFSLGAATTTLVGQALGGREPEEAARWGWACAWIGLAFIALISAPLILAPRWSLGFFLTDSAAVELAAVPLQLHAAASAFFGMGIILINAVMGAGDSRRAMVLSLALQWLLALPSVYLFGPGLGYGLLGVSLAQLGFGLVLPVAFGVMWSKGRWKTVEV